MTENKNGFSNAAQTDRNLCVKPFLQNELSKPVKPQQLLELMNAMVIMGQKMEGGA